jgi:lambda family phage minor tail protein L
MADNVFNVELHSLSSRAIVELFVLEYVDTEGVTQIVRFHPGTNELRSEIIWHGDTYAPMPFKFSEMEISGQGMLPRPKISVANMGGVISALVYPNNDLIGAKITRKRTFVRFLDAVNFPGGVNPDADETIAFDDEIFYVEQKEIENDLVIDFRLVSALDVSGLKLPRRQIIANTCTWRYRGSECGFTSAVPWAIGTTYYPSWVPTAPAGKSANGVFVTHNSVSYRCILGHSGVEPGLPDNGWETYWEVDSCGKSLAECKQRFGSGAITALPYGGFPGVFKVPQIG